VEEVGVLLVVVVEKLVVASFAVPAAAKSA